LLAISYPKARLSDMVLGENLASEIRRVIREQRHAEKILAHGLSPRRKLLLLGPPGTGKTLTASVLAGELGLPLFQVRLDGLLTKFMGETAAKLRQVFEATGQTRGVYFFDEFDAIGSQRSASNDVGEIRRVLNSFLLMIEQDQSHSLILAATNHPDILDTALFRRFDDVLSYTLPDTQQIEELLRSRLEVVTRGVRWSGLAAESAGLSYAEVGRAVEEVLKAALIEGTEEIGEAEILRMLTERKEIRRRVPSGLSGPEADREG
jgi:SpoVK/Ycf46/Vps4 family AAA+-type ATPase